MRDQARDGSVSLGSRSWAAGSTLVIHLLPQHLPKHPQKHLAIENCFLCRLSLFISSSSACVLNAPCSIPTMISLRPNAVPSQIRRCLRSRSRTKMKTSAFSHLANERKKKTFSDRRFVFFYTVYLIKNFLFKFKAKHVSTPSHRRKHYRHLVRESAACSARETSCLWRCLWKCSRRTSQPWWPTLSVCSTAQLMSACLDGRKENCLPRLRLPK